MQFRFGLVLGLAIGYVLGAKAGRQRYEQIVRLWGSVKGSQPAQQLGQDVRVAASKAGQQIGSKANEGVAKVTDLVRGETSNGEQR
ncbi:MAG: hypothetical protein GEU81_05885 [Nitriliruptorales bacterium]|nr:hypothetical protein [Nitriliruptorales bacterium]